MGDRPPEARALGSGGRPAFAARGARGGGGVRSRASRTRTSAGSSLKGLERGRAYGKDLYEDRLVRTIDRLYLFWVVLTLGIPFLIGYLVFDGGVEGCRGDGLGWPAPDLPLPAATFSVNSICHMFGRKDCRSRTRRGTTGSSLCSSSARAGTTTTMRFRAPPATASTAGSSTWCGDPRARAARPHGT